MSFSQHGPRAVCVLSANGAISNVTLRQPATSGGTVTYEVCELAYYKFYVRFDDCLIHLDSYFLNQDKSFFELR